MKIFTPSKNLKQLAHLLIALSFIAVMVTSCKKDHHGGDDDDDTNLTAYVQVTNSAMGSPAQDFYLDNTKVSTWEVPYGASTAFLTIKAGDHEAGFKTSGSPKVNTTLDFTVDPGKYYSVFYADSCSYSNYLDDRTAPQSGKARVRFINLSSKLPSNVDIAAAGGAKLVSNLAFKAASGYYDLDAATAFSITLTDKSTALIDIPAGMQPGHIYTIYISGTTSATVTPHIVTEK
jgi:uncharacterized protein DUF4397